MKAAFKPTNCQLLIAEETRLTAGSKLHRRKFELCSRFLVIQY